MTIQSITVENVKGIASKTLNLNVLANRPSLLVAPNGFGKSSLAVAFASMNTNRLVLDKNHFHNGDSTRAPRLALTYEDSCRISHSLEANSESNSIANHFDCFVINSLMKAKGVRKNFGGSTQVSASLTIEPVVLIDTIPESVKFDYSHSVQKSNFGRNGKVLPNITKLFKNSAFIEALSEDFSLLDRALGARVSRQIADIVHEINAKSGTTDSLRQWVVTNRLPNFEAITQLTPLVDLIQNSTLGISPGLDTYFAIHQVLSLYKQDKSKFKKACKYSNYKREKSEYEAIIFDFNSSKHNIRPRERQGKLQVEFPNAHLVSNGERDVLSFVSLLHRAKRKLKKNNCILVIDEVFDYLDDANLVAVQYYTTQLIDEYKGSGNRIYPLILTHLNPYFFKNFAFSKQKEYFLALASNQPDTQMVKLLRERENKNSTIADDVSKYLLHYSAHTISKREEFKALGLKETWGELDNFRQYTEQELQKYVQDEPTYDPHAVCCAVRTTIERRAHDALATQEQKDQFLSINVTRKKLAYAEDVGVEVPESHYLLGIIYNDGMHWRENADNITPIVTKLENLTIRNMIRRVHQGV